MVRGKILPGDLSKARKTEVDQAWIWIGVRPVEMALFWAWLAIGENSGKADPAPLDARERSGGCSVQRGRKQHVVDLRNRILPTKPVGPSIFWRRESIKHID